MKFYETATFVWWYCGIMTPIVLAIGVWANLAARAARRRNTALKSR